MSHSTHVGFSAPLVSETTIDKFACFPIAMRRWIAGFDRLPRSRQSDACGVGHSLTAVCRFMPPSPCNPAPVWQFAWGVGHFSSARMISVRFAPDDLRPEQGRGVGKGARKFRGERPADRSAIAFVFVASGVGNNPDSVPPVRGTNGARWYAMPFRVIPDLGQGPENDVQPSTKQRCHVLQDDVTGSNHASGSNHFPEESRTGAGKPGAGPGIGEVLAREARADDVGMGILRRSYVADVRRIRETQRENLAGVMIDFGDRDSLEPARALQPEVEAADTREQGQDAQRSHAADPNSWLPGLTSEYFPCLTPFRERWGPGEGECESKSIPQLLTLLRIASTQPLSAEPRGSCCRSGSTTLLLWRTPLFTRSIRERDLARSESSSEKADPSRTVRPPCGQPQQSSVRQPCTAWRQPARPNGEPGCYRAVPMSGLC